MWVNPELNQSDAFVAAWFPGSEGEGVADVLIGGKTDFHGRLSFAWPDKATQFTLANGRDKPLFPLNYGLTYAAPGHVGTLSEVAGIDASQFNTDTYFARGRVPAPFHLSLGEGVTSHPVDSASMQEGAMQLTWTAQAQAAITGPTLNLERELNGELNVQVTYRMEHPADVLKLAMGDGTVDLSRVVQADHQWHELRVPLKCFRDHGAAMAAITRPVTISGAKTQRSPLPTCVWPPIRRGRSAPRPLLHVEQSFHRDDTNRQPLPSLQSSRL
jgi:beta-glucosidase